MLNLVEELLLIALDEDTGKMSLTATSTIYYGIAGAILLELHRKGCLDYQNKYVILLDKEDTEDELLNEALQFLKENEKGKKRTLQHWVHTLSTHISWKKKHLPYIQRLVKKGILKQDEVKFLFIFTQDVYPSNYTGKEHALRDRLKKAVLAEEEIDEQSLLLIGLLKACNLDRQLFTREEYKLAKKKIEYILKHSPYGKAVSDTIQAMYVAIYASVAAASIASTSSSSSS